MFELKYEECMIDGLVMDSGCRNILRLFVKSFVCCDWYGEEVLRSMWFVDFVRGKGSGLIFFFYGWLGVGKICIVGMRFLGISVVMS